MDSLHISLKLCTDQTIRALFELKSSKRLSQLIRDRIIELPVKISVINCFVIKIRFMNTKFLVSFACVPDRTGKPPSTLKYYMKNFENRVSERVLHEILEKLGYNGDIKTFIWENSKEAPEGGFSKIIDELLRIIDVLQSEEKRPELLSISST